MKRKKTSITLIGNEDSKLPCHSIGVRMVKQLMDQMAGDFEESPVEAVEHSARQAAGSHGHAEVATDNR
jgi:hypothetical protein